LREKGWDEGVAHAVRACEAKEWDGEPACPHPSPLPQAGEGETLAKREERVIYSIG